MSNVTGGSNLAPYKHDRRQRKTEQDRTREQDKNAGGTGKDSTTNEGDRPTVQPTKATI